jgi:CRP-like cAMP-binding protein
MQQNDKTPPPVLLNYKPGETIIKGGDFGISIYIVVNGKVEVYIESGEEEVTLTTLGPGEIIGEMIFLKGNTARRSASVRAIEATVLESWHPAKLTKEFGGMPLILKYMANQVARRLIRMNRMITKLETVKAKIAVRDQHEPWVKHRKFYRKEVNIECMYRPVRETSHINLWGHIKDLSKSGMRLDILESNTYRRSHKPGDEFMANAILPSGQRLDVPTMIARIHEPPAKGVLSMGMTFTKIDQNLNKTLGFFLMPSNKEKSDQ